MFDLVRDRFNAVPDITGTELYAFSHEAAENAGWLFGGKIAGHIVGEFPNAHIPGEKDQHRINAANPGRLREPDANVRVRHWNMVYQLIKSEKSRCGQTW